MGESLIDRMDRWLSANRPEYYALLRPGASDAELDALEKRLSLMLPDAFRALYRWRNGQDPRSFSPLQMNWSFLTLTDIAGTKEILDGMIGHDFDDPRWWRRAWIPFLSNGGGSYLCLDTAAEDGGHPGQIIEFWKADEDRPIAFRSLEAWLTNLVVSMEDGRLELI